MKHNVNIECADNGWLIRWTRYATDAERYKAYNIGMSQPKLNGTELFTKHADMIKRVKELTG